MKFSAQACALSRLLLTSEVKSAEAVAQICEGTYGTVKFRPEDLKVKPGMFNVGFEAEFLVNQEPPSIEISDIPYDEFGAYFYVGQFHVNAWNSRHQQETGEDDENYIYRDLEEIVRVLGVEGAIAELDAEPFYGWVPGTEQTSVYTADTAEDLNLNDVAYAMKQDGFQPVQVYRISYPDRWTVTEDTSLPDNGVEVASPVFPLETVFRAMENMFGFIEEHGTTDDTCGFHVGISFVQEPEEIDLLKLVVLMGEKGVAKMFGRENNSFTKSHLESNLIFATQMMKRILKKIRDRDATSLNDVMAVVSDDKYRTANLSKWDYGKYIEFRVMGGDNYHKRLDEIKQTVLRFCAALSAAIDPEAYRKEYLKQLYYLANHGQTTEQDKLDVSSVVGYTRSFFKKLFKVHAIGVESIKDDFSLFDLLRWVNSARNRGLLQDPTTVRRVQRLINLWAARSAKTSLIGDELSYYAGDIDRMRESIKSLRRRFNEAGFTVDLSGAFEALDDLEREQKQGQKQEQTAHPPESPLWGFGRHNEI